ncbi:hypothetical protein Q4595_02920 [Wenyingzhuangia sp. 1_MG-2023]|nr:hypothetical protein [Wenyingzhuangia sp. 1_MG-2023]
MTILNCFTNIRGLFIEGLPLAKAKNIDNFFVVGVVGLNILKKEKNICCRFDAWGGDAFIIWGE